MQPEDCNQSLLGKIGAMLKTESEASDIPIVSVQWTQCALSELDCITDHYLLAL
jgi:hypothetical protein